MQVALGGTVEGAPGAGDSQLLRPTTVLALSCPAKAWSPCTLTWACASDEQHACLAVAACEAAVTLLSAQPCDSAAASKHASVLTLCGAPQTRLRSQQQQHQDGEN